MTKKGVPSGPTDLTAIRAQIDSIDEALHMLLLLRSDIIGRLIEVKKTSESGSAFRPGRENEVLRQRAERHRGLLPFTCVENVWRVIISTFTWVQAPYTVFGAVEGESDLMRDVARFNFGFTVPYQPLADAAAVIAAVKASRGDLGLIPVHHRAGTPWWEEFTPPEAPKIIAELPLALHEDTPFPAPVFVVANPIIEPEDGKRYVYAARLVSETGMPESPGFTREGVSLRAQCRVGEELSCLLTSRESLVGLENTRLSGNPEVRLASLCQIGRLPHPVIFGE
ncbi:MAG: chorismate mutase [Methylobacteriaceae bacterium]|jgi:chorismate mutase|nr:chorismate mutase [Methylobacteriaceae bacterium]